MNNKEFLRKYSDIMEEQENNIKHLHLKADMTQDPRDIQEFKDAIQVREKELKAKALEKHNSMFGAATIGAIAPTRNETCLSTCSISLADLGQFKVQDLTKDMILAAEGVRDWEVFTNWLKRAQRDMPETVIKVIQELMNGHYNR